MGEVYRARDTRLKRDVAIKILPASFAADAERLRRFEQEAQAASALNHPNITAVYDIGSHEGAPYIVQELLEGESLRAILASGPLAPRRAIEYALQIAHGLAAAHEKGIVHRDLKPENIFVTRDGRGKILDFGLAKALEPALGATASESAATAGYTTPVSGQTALPTETPATDPGSVLGTLSYMSPEQVRGWPTDARSDIFSFGAILYEMLSGQRAFRRVSGADTISAILKEDPPDLSATNRQIPPAIDRVVRHCLEKEPERRFQTARDLAFDLAALSNLSETAVTPAARRRAPAWVVPVVAAILVLAGVFLWKARSGRAARPVASAPEAKSIAVLPFQNLSP